MANDKTEKMTVSVPAELETKPADATPEPAAARKPKTTTLDGTDLSIRLQQAVKAGKRDEGLENDAAAYLLTAELSAPEERITKAVRSGLKKLQGVKG